MACQRFSVLMLAYCLLCSLAHAQQDRAKLVREDLANFDRSKYWIYNDLEKGIAKARETGRPMLVVFR